MGKDFGFQIPLVYVMLKLTIRVASTTTTTANSESFVQLRSWVNTIFRKTKKSFNSSNTQLTKSRIPQMRYMQLNFWTIPAGPVIYFSSCINMTSGVLFTGHCTKILFIVHEMKGASLCHRVLKPVAVFIYLTSLHFI